METLQETIIKRRTSSSTAIRNAQHLDCATFYNQYEKFIELDQVDNMSDMNDGYVNLVFHGTDVAIAIVFCNGDYIEWSYVDC